MCTSFAPKGAVQQMNTPPQSPSNQGDRSSRSPEDPLLKLVSDTCAHPPGSAQRQRGQTKLIRALGPQLWHTYDAYYADALQQTWIYFCRNLCEATTGRAYNPAVARLTTWLNAYLKRRLQDFRIAETQQRAKTVSSYSSRGDGVLDPVDRLPAPADIPPLLEQVLAWAQTDADGSLRATHINNHPTVTAQLLILKRLPPETPWKELSADYGISVGTLSSFYQRQCLTRLREFGQQQGYL
ncbi:MAG: sigma-70 family RNA polymerase sigma factor [Cyanobacteria bacterium J06555_13]